MSKSAMAILTDEEVLRRRDRDAFNGGFQAAVELLLPPLKDICDSLRSRQGSKLIHIDHDELMRLIPVARAAIAQVEQP